ncbi:sensor histidine kinase [Dokdonia pacifica]|uniref:Histidine kinase n=1 Tax=Dokdonia pacifica TaxID=1627892 RepID=A0A238VT52_9FLAO|nr:histidine kinase [Dokdonia pacifica]SNR37495.1 Histidine kinase [Dokdonia pacifica]
MKLFSIYKRLLISLIISLILVAMIWITSQFKEPPQFGFLTVVWILMIYATFEVIFSFQKSKRIKAWFQKNMPFQVFILFGSILIGTIVYTLLFYGFKWFDYWYYHSESPTVKHMIMAALIGLCISIIFSLIEYVSNLKTTHYNTLLENEKYKHEITEANLSILKNQLDPHFLFNNLNTLYYLIDEDTTLAKSFLKNISDIYRQILQNKHHITISAPKEYEMAQQYLQIIKQRYQEGLQVENTISKAQLQDKKMPPLVLQQLIENAIKHNKIDIHTTLKIVFSATKDTLVITTIGQKKTNTNTHGSGLVNIKKRYSYLTDKKITISSENDTFKVTVPLL